MSKKIGLALGSGAARGWAHIGIIEALQELGIEFDIVAGCSIGAYVGAAFANDKLPELKEWVSSFTEWQVAGLLGVGFQRGGLISGEKVFTKLAEDFVPKDIQQLHKRFGAVATDLYRAREVSFTDGDVVEAVRASCSIPAVFPAHWYRGTWLVDGAVVNPVPVSLCRQMGADIVIAVNLNSNFYSAYEDQLEEDQKSSEDQFSNFLSKSKSVVAQWWGDESRQKDVEEQKTPIGEGDNLNLPRPKKSPTMIGTMSGALDIMQDRVTRSRLAGEPPDILLEPQLGRVGIMEFHRAEELIDEGRANVERLAQQIKYRLGL
ncbi:patatin-like phospholipase RssA [Neptunicella sp. SCSIO 80796]|uniref:patatin-like phospholipase RssA n=1 Tax=Neptunicella plasticusilytica TaxID=3117012 RepID=UPI003A4D39DE